MVQPLRIQPTAPPVPAIITDEVIVFTPGMRQLIADAIESLMLLLDEIDGDPDLEDGGDIEMDRAE